MELGITMATSISSLLSLGISIKPTVKHNEIVEILKEFYGMKCGLINELNGYDDINYHVKVEEKCENNIKEENEDGYVLKIINSLDSQKPELFEAQTELLLHLGKNGTCCPQPVKSKTGQYYITKKFSSGKHIVRLLEFISGSILDQVPSSRNLFYECGKYVAKLDKTLEGFHHFAYDNHKTVWHLASIPQLSQFLFAIKEPQKKKIVEDVITTFSKRVLPVSHRLEKGMIHGDFNEQNILVDQKDDGQWYIKGILDFGDSHFSCYLYDLAITMTYIMIKAKSIDAGGYVIAGYNSIRNLSDEEFNLLKVSVEARLCQSLVLGAYTSLQDPDNSYILVSSKPGWILLEALRGEDEQKLLSHWKNVADETKSRLCE